MIRTEQQEQTKAPIQVLEANYLEDTDAVRKDSPAYLLSVAEQRSNSNGIRVRLYVQARDGRYISIWQRRALVGKFRLVNVGPRNPIYDYLSRNAHTLDALDGDA